mgnify:CR=1 FL=1
MTTETEAARENARAKDGRFGAQPKTHPEIFLTVPAAPLGTYDIPVDEVNAGDTLLFDGVARHVNETWVSQERPGMRIIATPDGGFELDREARAHVVRTGDEPKPEDHDHFAGYCHVCGQAFSRDPDGATSHIHPRGGRDYNEDEDHTPYTLDDADEFINQFGTLDDPCRTCGRQPAEHDNCERCGRPYFQHRDGFPIYHLTDAGEQDPAQSDHIPYSHEHFSTLIDEI